MIVFKSLINGVLDKKYVKTQVSHSSSDTYDFEDRDVIGKVKLLKLKGNGEFVGSPITYQIKAFKPTSITIGDTVIDLSSIMEHFPNGLLGNNNIYDEIDFVNQKAIKKINSQTGEPLSVMSIETYDFDIGINEYDFGDITIQNNGEIDSNLNFEFYSLQV